MIRVRDFFFVMHVILVIFALKGQRRICRVHMPPPGWDDIYTNVLLCIPEMQLCFVTIINLFMLLPLLRIDCLSYRLANILAVVW